MKVALTKEKTTKPKTAQATGTATTTVTKGKEVVSQDSEIIGAQEHLLSGCPFIGAVMGRKVQTAPFESVHVELHLNIPVRDIKNVENEASALLDVAEGLVVSRISRYAGSPAASYKAPQTPKTTLTAPPVTASDLDALDTLGGVCHPTGTVKSPVYSEGKVEDSSLGDLSELDDLI